MRITQEADYALRIVSLLAGSETPVGAPQVAEAVGVPSRFAMKILRKLSLGGVVKSTRGVSGGYRLALPPEEISLRSVIETIDGEIAIRHCLLADHICSRNADKGACRFHHVFAELNGMITERLSRLSIGDMVNDNIPINELVKILK